MPARPGHARLVAEVMRTLAREIGGLALPAIEQISHDSRDDPFQILIGTLLSARTKDATTDAATRRLFRAARTPRSMARLPVKEIARLIYPVGFYKNKARFVKATCEALVERFGGKVPDTLEQLITLPGVGRKTANLVLIVGFKSGSNICVDTHVHRISNRLGWVVTEHPEETERALYAATPRKWWPYINLYLVTWGQNICKPMYPRCSACRLEALCPKRGVVHPRNHASSRKSRAVARL